MPWAVSYTHLDVYKRQMQCSLSGLENQCNALLAACKTPEYVCKYCLLCVADTVVKMTKAAQKRCV